MIVIAALLLVTSCSSNNATNKQMTHRQAKVETHARNADTLSTLTQASSISTAGAGKSSIMVKQAPIDASDWLDGSKRINAPGEGSADQSVNPQQSADTSKYAQEVLDLVNQERTKAGLESLSLDSNLSKMALAKAQDMYNNNYFDHQSPTYGSPFDMMKAFGITYNSAGENIANGQTSPTEVVNQWMNSPGHRATS